MLLRWVLNRDIDAVSSMLNRWPIEGDDATQITRETWDNVIRTYLIDDSLPKEEAAPIAVAKAERFLHPAQDEIYGFLCSDEIYGVACRNGSGDLAIMDSFHWAGLRFRSLDGHDIAVPVDDDRKPLPLPHPLTDYLSGLVPTTSTPTVWPDPEFPGERAMMLWPSSDLYKLYPELSADTTQSADDNAKEDLPKPRRRGEYQGPLGNWMARQEVAVLKNMGTAAIAKAFRLYCEQELPEILSRLPKRSRDMSGAIETHIRDRERRPSR